jgi:hypothetical protein
MKTFNEGDRVSHLTYGEGTVSDPYNGTGWLTVQFDNGDKMMTDVRLLTPAPTAKFKVGDRVSHKLHPDGTVEDMSMVSGLLLINIGGNRAYRALPHQIARTKPEPKFTVTVTYPEGGKCETVPFARKQVEAVLTELSDWDTVESITINRVKG